MGKMKFKTVDLAYVALGAGLIAVCSWLAIPTTVPFTMQTFAVFAVLSILGGARGTASIAVYLALGAVGVPVFAQFTAGVGILLGATGGYLVGFLLTGICYWITTAKYGNSLRAEIPALALGLLLCYAFGTAWFMSVYNRQTGPVGLTTALAWCVLPFLLPDAAKLALALTVSRRVRPRIK